MIKPHLNKNIEKLIGILPKGGNSVQEVREMRKKLSKNVKRFKDLEKLNTLVD